MKTKNSFKTIVIIPTYNEAENIAKLILEILKIDFKLDILVIDDNSQDQTSKIVKDLSKSYKCINILERPKKLGLGSAYRDGFKYCIQNEYDKFIQIDADFSHRIIDLKKMLTFIEKFDVIIGSRYISGGRTLGWNKIRKYISKFANIFSKFVTNSEIHDMTSGFRIYSLNALNKIKYYQTKSNGYGFQIEMSARACLNNLRIIEVPIIFHERRQGKSKMNYKIILEAFLVVLKLRFNK